MHRITVTCRGLSEAEGCDAPSAILEEFSHRPWWLDPECSWQGGELRFSATSDVDEQGSALLDEYWDAVIACVTTENALQFAIVSSTPIAS